ncbi:FAD-binding oxidoreductase, partial [Mesorhizobium sp. M1050]
MSPETQQLLSAIDNRLGAGGVLAGADVNQRYRDDPDGKLGALPEAVLRPRAPPGVAPARAGWHPRGPPGVGPGGRPGGTGAGRG